jgi:hypothetical protein
MRRDLFADFCGEYVRELNRLRMEHRAGLSSARTELAAAEREIRRLVQAIKDGVSARSIKPDETFRASRSSMPPSSTHNANDCGSVMMLNPRNAQASALLSSGSGTEAALERRFGAGRRGAPT